MNDKEIRSELKSQLIAKYFGDSETVIIDELGLRHGACRIDLVVVNGVLHGFELKSNSDTLKRLARQAETYNRILDRVTLVLGVRHFQKASAIVPDWWGLQVADRTDRGVQLVDLRDPQRNPSPDPVAIARLLWRDEALALLREVDRDRGFHSKRRAAIYARLAEVLGLEFLRARVRERLRAREGWRSAGQRVSCGGLSLHEATSLGFPVLPQM